MSGRWGLINVGNGKAMVLSGPPMSAWSKSPDGRGIDVFVLQAWTNMDLDSFIERAIRETPTEKMTDTTFVWKLHDSRLVLMFAGDDPTRNVYSVHTIPIRPGDYRILEGHFRPSNLEEIFIYRIVPSGR